MTGATTFHRLRVFCAPDASGGNELAVFLDGGEVEPDDRQAVAKELGFSETVFLDDIERGELRIFTPAVELALAGHPAASARHGCCANRVHEPAALRPPAGEVGVALRRRAHVHHGFGPSGRRHSSFGELGSAGCGGGADGRAAREPVTSASGHGSTSRPD